MHVVVFYVKRDSIAASTGSTTVINQAISRAGFKQVPGHRDSELNHGFTMSIAGNYGISRAGFKPVPGHRDS